MYTLDRFSSLWANYVWVLLSLRLGRIFFFLFLRFSKCYTSYLAVVCLCVCVFWSVSDSGSVDDGWEHTESLRPKSEWMNQTRSISLQNYIPSCSSCCWINWMILTPQQCSALRACPHPAPPCLLCLWFLMTKCIETIGWTLPSIRRHSEGSLCGSGPQDFRRLTKQLLLALDWLAAMLFSPTGKRLCESAGLNEVAGPRRSVHLLTL